MAYYDDENNGVPQSRRNYRSYLLRARGVDDWSDIENMQGIHIGMTKGEHCH